MIEPQYISTSTRMINVDMPPESTAASTPVSIPASTPASSPPSTPVSTPASTPASTPEFASASSTEPAKNVAAVHSTELASPPRTCPLMNLFKSIGMGAVRSFIGR
ncbi:eukaryotic translation initiation factor 3 subunit F-like [Nilaparvata lugens]|uniref:eukaryotic translation initiation factor 3 subunit F-like n=1 Tax=Nilaparvata lugens TaxID=108931 RepID=UPI000B97FCC1|nr:eukaryotic translation initiation factor 3 subunit F-like [Nilaparvata lugens]